METEGGVTTVTVSVRQFNGLEQDSSSVPDAPVVLSLERPIAENNEPGIVEPGFTPMTGTTNADGRVQFTLPDTMPGQGFMRLVYTVTDPWWPRRR